MNKVNLTIAEAAKLLSVTPEKIQNLLDAGELYYKFVDGNYLIPSQQLNMEN